MRNIIIFAVLLNLLLPSYATVSYDDITTPKKNAYRAGLSDEPE